MARGSAGCMRTLIEGSSSKMVDWFFSVIGFRRWCAAADETTEMTESPLGMVEVRDSFVWICCVLGAMFVFRDCSNFLLDSIFDPLTYGYLYYSYSSTRRAVYSMLCAICKAIFGYSTGYRRSRWINLSKMTSDRKVTSIFKVRFSNSEVWANQGKTLVGFNKLPA